MGFLPRFLSISLRRKKKKDMPPPPPPPVPRPSASSAMPPPSISSLSLPLAANSVQQRVSENELLRMSSRNCSVYSQIDYLSADAPPIPHPINEVMRSHSRASTVDRQGNYVVRVHSRQSNVPSSTSSTTDRPPATRKPVPAQPVTPPPSTIRTSAKSVLTPEDARQLARLRSDASVSNLVGLYTRQEHDLNDHFRNTPAREKKQRNRRSTDLRSLLHVGADDDSVHGEGESGDVIAWADRILIDATMVSSLTAAQESPRKNAEQDTSFSSLAVEAGSTDTHTRRPSDDSPIQVLPQAIDGRSQLQRSGSVRASVVFDFLLRKDEQGITDPDRSIGSLRRATSSGAILTRAAAPQHPMKSSTTTMLQDKPISQFAHAAAFAPSRAIHVPYPGAGTRLAVAPANLDPAARSRTSSAPLQNETPQLHGFSREIKTSHHTSVQALPSNLSSSNTGTGRVGGPRPMRNPSPVKPRAPPPNKPISIVTANQKPRALGSSNMAPPITSTQDAAARPDKRLPFVSNDSSNPFDPVDACSWKPINSTYVEKEDKENVFPRQVLLEAPSPAPSRASSSELSPAGQKMMSDIRLKRGTARRDAW